MLRPIQPCIDYILNQEYIATVLCINRDKPKLQCNGKCQLAKELEKQDNSDSPQQNSQLALELYPIGFVSILEIPNDFKLWDYNPQAHFFYNNLYTFNFESSMFHPPTLI